MVEGAGAELMQQSGQDLAWWECGFSSYTYIVLEAENPGCAKHIKRLVEEARTSCWKWTDLKEGTTHNTMARRTIAPGACTL